MRAVRFAAAILFLATSLLAAAGWADRGEYDLAMAVRAEASAPRKLELLDQWKQRYPDSGMSQARRELYLAAYLTQGDAPHILEVAREMLAAEPANFVGLYWSALLVPEAKEATPELWDQGEKSARALLAFTPDKKPDGLSDAEWQARKDSVELLSHRTLGWIAWQRGDHPSAERDFTAYLTKHPNSAEISGWLGIVTGLQNSPEKKQAALWHLARAAALRDEGALPEEPRRQMAMLSERTYLSYHGNTDGLDQIQGAAKAAAFPPADFKVESAAAIAARLAEEELNRTNPELAAWMRIRKQLDTPDGDAWFAQNLKGQPLPKLKGVLIRTSPAKKPNELVLAISSPAEEEVVIQVSTPYRNEADAGATLEFTAKAESFSRQPFRLTVSADPSQIDGWPEPATRTRR